MSTEDKLLDKNTKPTNMRILVYDFLAEQKGALSLSEIEAHFFHADRTTIYRTVKTFEEKGLVHSIREHNTSKYKLCEDDCNEEMHHDAHLHLYCKICGQTTCREEFKIPDMAHFPFRIDDVELFAKGICGYCLKEHLQ